MEKSDKGLAEAALKTSSKCARILPRTPDPRSPSLLPPIVTTKASSSGHPTPISKSPRNQNKLWSGYHTGCRDRNSIYMDWTSVKPEKKTSAMSVPKARSLTSVKEETQEKQMMEYLDHNKDFLEKYVTERVPIGVVQKLLLNKIKQNQVPNTSASYYRDLSAQKYQQKGRFDKKRVFMELLNVLKEDATEYTVVYELASYISTSVGVDAYRIYKLYPDHHSFVQYFSPPSEVTRTLLRAKPQQVKMVLDVAKRGICQRLCRAENPARFPETPITLFRAFNKPLTKANYVMYQPIFSKTGKTIYVIEMWRDQHRFTGLDEEISSNFLVLGSMSLHYCNMYLNKKRERNMSDFLLDVVKAIFEEMVSLDQLIKRILEFAQRLVNADRASLFLVDYRNYELVSTVFDLKFEPGHERDMEKKEIRMPISRGIAGHVALTGEAMNIPDAYSDYRFNREVDEATGYKTVNILCMPIKVEGRVIGVVQMVNKRDEDNFDHEDEVSFEIFSTFFGLALHHARLYDRIMRKEQKYRVALEVLSYHNTCRESEVITMLSEQNLDTIDLNHYYIDPFKFDEFEKCKCVIQMFRDLFDLANFDLSTLTRFVLTVRKNYRTVPYHNFDHGWTVAHTMYVMLKNDHQKRFNYKMRLALFVACLCHDLDHRGYTNKYMSEIASPLAAMYTTSTLEHHHFNITVTILQQDGHNIFSHISSSDYKEILNFIRHCILATDLAKFFPNLAKLNQLLIESPPEFNWAFNSHRDLAMAISMTAADLSAAAKPWEIQIKTVKVIFEEFYDQGDKERASGRVPIPMMDRHKPDEQPSSQVGFLSQICIPCYSALYQILPNTRPMYIMALKNLEGWKARANKIQQKQEGVSKTDDENDDEEDQDYENVIAPIAEINDNACSVADLEPISWEEVEVGQENLATRGSIWKNIDGSTWIDEEGVVITKETLQSIIRKEAEE